MMGDMNTPPWQAQVMAESKHAVGARRGRVPMRVAVEERTGLFLIRRGERLRRDAHRHRPAPIS